MDYVLGSIADMISGNVTPSRPKIAKRALTPIKHMQSPNVTPKSELVEDRSIFLSPTMQKKKAMVKKSPKRIFQNPNLDEGEDNPSTSPKADKVKKHLKSQLEAGENVNKSKEGLKTSKKKSSKSAESGSPNVMAQSSDLNGYKENVSVNELTPKKKKKQRNSVSEVNENTTIPVDEVQCKGSPKKKKKQKKNSTSEDVQDNTHVESSFNIKTSVTPKKKKKKDFSNTQEEVDELVYEEVTEDNGKKNSSNKKNKKHKNKKLTEQESKTENQDEERKLKKNKKKIKVNPNAITDKDSDSEHESDNEIESENEETNRKVLENSGEAADSSSDEEETPKTKKKEKKHKKEKVENQETEPVREVNTAEEIARTLFVGNVPFSKKCKKEIKKIFSKYGQIESVRIRTVPVKDPSVTPKVAVIKQELHPERTTVNVYVKFANPTSVDEALAENNTVLNEHHLRVTRSGSTGAEHDARRAVFVGNVPFALEDDALRERFSGCGQIESVRIVRDKNTNAGKGFAYVNFASKDGVELALALTEEDLTIKNRIMRVKRCTQITQRQVQKREFKHQGVRPGSNQPRQFPGKKVSQGDRQRNFQGDKSQGFQGNRFGRQESERGNKDGAYRRINKRKNHEAGEGGPGKARDDQPREKKARKEFVGMTAEKKKKHKFDKGLKKKKALSEILTK